MQLATSRNDRLSITLPLETWEGVLYHLEDTVERIPLSVIEPDRYECVTQAIQSIKFKLNETQDDLDDL